ncbi:hypothetical protein HZ994_18735 [Akkermansiaceae bacterium]|nr:hypothetical protein HZ994_18735 [Akkermansiaceae bacterium]
MPNPLNPIGLSVFITGKRACESRGFALVVTLSLMVLLSIIALGMLSISSIALRASGAGDANMLARANARMALMMAIGQLQREMGPDSRISTPHDLGGQPGGNPGWVGVFDAWKTDPANSTTPSTPQSRVLKFRTWLVSGADGTGVTTGDMVSLLGTGSLGTNAAADDLVSAPLVELTDPGKKGKIAWWVSDESVKAKVNAGPESPNNPAFGNANAFFNAQSAPNVGHKAFTELASLDWKEGQRGATVSTGALGLAAGLGASGVGAAIHDLTVHSSGVLADVREGRLKRDLSSLLARPIAELENKPLYLADGRMNRFEITEQGAISNAAYIPPSSGAGANRWGINLEELHLFHQIHREIDWSSGKPQLVNKSSRSQMVNDRFFIYRKPTMEAVSLILSLIASPEAGTNPVTYRMDANMDTIIALSNPNDIPTVWPDSVRFRVDTEGFPYRPDWNITRNGVVIVGHVVQPINSQFFKSSLQTGFTLEAGEAAVFGASTTDTQATQVNLTRGYVPRGGVRIEDGAWDTNNRPDPSDGLRATGLRPTDKMDFSMIPAPAGNGNTPSGWISSYARMTDTSGGGTTNLATHRFGGGGGSNLNTAPTSTYTPASIRPSQRPEIREFIGKPLPVIMFTTMSNTERSRTSFQPPNAIPSRPYLIHEPATTNMIAITNQAPNTLLTMHSSQLVSIADPMDYAFGNDRTMAAGAGGRNLYHGGSREAGLGGSFNVVKRRIPLVAPLSLGAFENAIACGFSSRFAGGPSLSAAPDTLPTMPAPRPNGNGMEPEATMVTLAKSIGNSWTNPFLSSDVIEDGTYHDQSWMVNTALWDSWFLSGIVDGRGAGASTWMSDSRSPLAQFRQFAETGGGLRNKRLIYHPSKPLSEALDELFTGDDFKPAAVNKLTKYLLVDGAFNVNSTSEVAWKAFLTSVKGQELLDASGSAQKKSHPFGTLGYAVSQATSGTDGDWRGFRDFSDSDLEKLSKAIVEEVKARGPFLNMADFVNRRPNGATAAEKALGALQAAIDKSGINSRFLGAGRTLVSADISMLAGKNTLSDEPTPARAIGGAGFFSQAALLTSLGPQITVRGDTFVIRTYGDHRSSTGTILSKAWCEAVVQRTPDYVDATDAPDTTGTLTAANESFGRKFKIISFRWLNSKEI